jgi:hypothetical protein
MPEGGEVDLDKVREAIDDAMEREGKREANTEGTGLLRAIALTTALLAAMAAVASLKAGSNVNEALVLKSEATELQAQASDQWAYYQAKGIKAAVAAAAASGYAAAGRAAPDSLRALGERYVREQAAITTRARELEHERDARSRTADILLARHHLFANAVALLQVAIALGAVAALTRRRTVWILSSVIGVAGVALVLLAALRP